MNANERDGPEKLEDHWNALSDGQYEPFSISLSKVSPLDSDLCSLVNNISFETPLSYLVVKQEKASACNK